MDAFNFIGNVGAVLIILMWLLMLVSNILIGKYHPLWVDAQKTAWAKKGYAFPRLQEWLARQKNSRQGMFGRAHQQESVVFKFFENFGAFLILVNLLAWVFNKL